jgi:hypothetical protein
VFYDVSGSSVEVSAIVPKSKAESGLEPFGQARKIFRDLQIPCRSSLNARVTPMRDRAPRAGQRGH